MRPYWTLYWKEVKNIGGAVLILSIFGFIGACIIPLDYGIAWILHIASYSKSPIIKFLTYANPGILFMVPILLIYSLNIERLNKTHYLILSLPIQKYLSIFLKFLAVITAGIIMSFIISIGGIVYNYGDATYGIKFPNLKSFESFSLLRLLYPSMQFFSVIFFTLQ
jgi:hypothetical protein